MAPKRARKTATQEQIFLEFVQQIDRHRAGRMALVVTLSPIETARGLQATQNLVCDQIKRHLDGLHYEMFRFGRGDVVVMTKGAAEGLMRDTAFGLVFQLKKESFFGLLDDGESDLCRVLSAEDDYEALLSYARMGVRGPVDLPGAPLQTIAHKDEVEDGDALPADEDDDVEIVTLSPDELEIYRHDDRDVDGQEAAGHAEHVTLETCREEVIRIPESGEPETVMSLMSADRDALEERFLSDADAETKAAYIPKILQEAEQQLLAQMAREPSQPEKLGIIAQVGTLLSAEFLSFDRARAAAGAWPRSFLVVDRDGVRSVDSFEFAREFVEGGGHELCLSGLGFQALAKVRLKEQGYAYQFVAWDAGEAELTTREEREQIREGVLTAGSAKTVLMGCLCEEAIAFGHKLGIELFVGRAASAMLTHAQYTAD